MTASGPGSVGMGLGVGVGEGDGDGFGAGGGPAGVCAALAAAEEGVDTLLVERYGFLGGMATAGLVNPFMPYVTGGEQVNAGAFQRMIDAFEAEGACEAYE